MSTKIKIKTIGKITYWLFVLAVALLAGLTLLSTFDSRLTAKVYVVQSGSMQPSISAGSLIMIKNVVSYAKGDIVTYAPRGAKTTLLSGLTTHRIVELRETSRGQEFVTKGDANNATDSATVKKEQILGKVVLAVPYLGYPISFTKTLPGLILVIVVPATIIIYQEIINLKNDILKRLALRRKKEKDEGKKN